MRQKRVIISGGGTGGHVYPALAVGRKLQEKNASLRLTYVGSHRDIEKKIMDEEGIVFIPMKIEGIRGRGIRSLHALVLLPSSLLRSLILLFRLKPDLVIGVGGFSSGPIVLLAAWLGLPTLILEQNLRPGLTNRILVRWAREAVVAFKNSLPYFRGKGTWLGNPVRDEFYTLAHREAGSKFTLLIFGGSQGSQILNRVTVEALPLLRSCKDRLALIHQTGEKDFDDVRRAYRDQGYEEAVVAPYFSAMADCFGKADLIISRAGATTCAELIASGRPSLLVPFAGAAENHQELNARELEAAGGAEVILEKDFNARQLASKVIYFFDHRERLARMKEGLAGLRTERSAERIAELCVRLMETKA